MDMFFDPKYLLFVGPGLILAIIATIKVRLTFDKYSKMASATGVTGAEAARRLLDQQGLRDVTIEQVGGVLSDHYDPTSRTLRLSPGVYGSNSLAAIGVACHEAGHALQHATGYAWLGMRTALVPATQFGSWGSYIIIAIGAMMRHPALILAGVILFAVVVAFSIITLPVEWDASARARRLMVMSGIVSYQEQEDAGRVLNAAFLTYVASAITSLLTFLYYVSLFTGSRRRD
jgi:Zn-dependent membrane protease YugP